MEISEVRWKSYFPANGVNAAKAYDEILRLKQKNGNAISPELLVESAKKQTSTLHNLFNWDDTDAARQYRLSQASHVLRSIEVIYIENPKRPARAFEIMSRKRSGDPKTVTLYATTEEACADPDVHARLVSEAVRGLIAWRNRYETLNEMRNIIRIIDKTVEELTTSVMQ